MEKKGFTLVEIVTVIVIIGILAGIAMPQYGRVVEKSRQVEAYTMLAQIRGALERYRTENSTYDISNDFSRLDIDAPAGVFFDYGIQSVSANAFSATASRKSGSIGYSAYSACVIGINESGNVTKITGIAKSCVE